MDQSPQASAEASFYIDKPVFFASVITVALLVVVATVMPEATGAVFATLQSAITEYASWYYVLVVAIILISVLFFGFSRLGDIKLGPDHSTPDYSRSSWFAMLFSAGMGIGLMFFGVAEPVMHFLAPPTGDPATVEAAKEAIRLTFFHWGLHGWAIYAIVALVLAYFAYRHNLPLTLRSALYPIIGDKIYGPIGSIVDTFAIVATICGVATSLGFGALQINSGLNYLTGLSISTGVQIVIVIVTMLLATLSLVMGLDAGIKRLSELNMGLAVILLVGVLVAGPTVLLLQMLMQNIGGYLSDLVTKTFNLYAYNPTDWLGGWTIFYWGWWLSWSPFVGLFIARISRGRTIREFVLGAMFVPCGFTLLWMSIFGNSGIELILHQGQTLFGAAVQENQAVALFKFLEYLPGAKVISGLAIVMVVVFFVTSADSGAMVLNMLSAHGRDDTPRLQRVLWTGIITVMTIALLLSGGLGALQTAAIASALPFSVALLAAIFGFAKALHLDKAKRDMALLDVTMPAVSNKGEWKKRLELLLQYPSENSIQRFQRESVFPALRDFGRELENYGLTYTLIDQIDEEGRAAIEVDHGGEMNFIYEVQCRAQFIPTDESGELIDPNADTEVYYRAEVHLTEGGQDYDVMGWSRDQVVTDIVNQYEHHVHFLQSIR
jgi:choline/glycine/proline betaine transport protein